MTIQEAKYTDIAKNKVLVIHDGVEFSMDAYGATWLHAKMDEWLKKGGTISPPDIPCVSDTKATKQRAIANAADSFLSSMAQEYGAYEKLTWDQQALESDALLANPDAPAPLVRAIATARGMTALEMAVRIAANRAQWVALSGAVVGKRLAYQDALDAAQTVEEVDAINPVFP